MTSPEDLESRLATFATRLPALRAALDGSRRADRSLCDAYRAVLRTYEDLVTHGRPGAQVERLVEQLRPLAREAMLYLQGEADVWSTSLKDYDHERYGPYLGVSDEGSAAAVIRRAALDSPKARAVPRPTPMVIGVAHDAERLGAVGEVPVGPEEYADIRLECTGRILTSTNVGTRLNLRFYKRHPVVTVPKGAKATALETARAQLRMAFAPFRDTPDGKPRPLIVFVEFDRTSRRDFKTRVAMLKDLVEHVEKGDIADSTVHRLGFQMRIGFGAKGGRAALLAVNLAGAAGIGEVAIHGVVRKEADELVSLPGLLNYLEAEHLQPVLDRAQAKGVRIRPKNTVDPDTVARNVWTSLLAARRMGLALGKYGTFPLTLEETDAVVRQVQGWFADWSAAPVFFVDQGILSAHAAYVKDTVVEGLKRWLRMVAGHGVSVVLIDTVDKAKGWRILADPAHPGKGLMSAAEIRAVDRFAAKLGVKVLWAGGITLAQTYAFGAMGVFGIYVTSAAASAAPVSAEYEADPQLAAMKEPTYESVARAKLLLEAGFLAERLKPDKLANEIERLAKQLIAVLGADADSAERDARARRLDERTQTGWTRYLGRRQPPGVHGAEGAP